LRIEEEDKEVKVILKENVERLGSVGEVVDVAAGYARNYLIPKNLAVRADEGKLHQIEHHKRVIMKREEKMNQAARNLAKRIEDFSCTIPAHAGEGDRLFGSVTAHNIADVLSAEGMEVDHKNVLLDEPIKELGVFVVPVRLDRGVETRLKVWVVKE